MVRTAQPWRAPYGSKTSAGSDQRQGLRWIQLRSFDSTPYLLSCWRRPDRADGSGPVGPSSGLRPGRNQEGEAGGDVELIRSLRRIVRQGGLASSAVGSDLAFGVDLSVPVAVLADHRQLPLMVARCGWFIDPHRRNWLLSGSWLTEYNGHPLASPARSHGRLTVFRPRKSPLIDRLQIPSSNFIIAAIPDHSDVGAWTGERDGMAVRPGRHRLR